MEEKLGQIQRLRVKGCCIRGARIRDVNDYYRQYVGVVVDGRRLIYVNAYAADEPLEGLKTTPVTGWCDGGESAWGVLYDAESKRFFDLAVNGLA